MESPNAPGHRGGHQQVTRGAILGQSLSILKSRQFNEKQESLTTRVGKGCEIEFIQHTFQGYCGIALEPCSFERLPEASSLKWSRAGLEAVWNILEHAREQHQAEPEGGTPPCIAGPGPAIEGSGNIC